MEEEMRAKAGRHSLLVRIIRRLIRKHVGVEIDPRINEFQVLNDGENSQIHVDLIVNMTTRDFEKILEKIGL
ncbi:MAG: hypothetical protein J6U54_11225 [Clostridiales bacterium]|nr:hypothetical protein [Clostridiales bacterium]